MTATSESTTEILKQDSLGRVRTPKEKREKILAEYERSGMSGVQFAEYAGIKYQTFATWVQKRKRAPSKKTAPAKQAVAGRWLEAVIGGSEPPESGKSGLVLELPGGIRMRVEDERQAVLAAAVLRQIGAGRC